MCTYLIILFQVNTAPSGYKSVLVRMMRYLDGTDYHKDHEFSTDRLKLLTPTDLMRWMNHEIFGTETPSLDQVPTTRSNTIYYWKKALSYFMVNRLMTWNSISCCGNATKCDEINDLIKRVKKAEVRKLGVPSQARRPFDGDDYVKIVSFLKEAGRGGRGIIWEFGVPAQMAYQFHFMARADDTMNVRIDNIDIHPQFDFCLKSKLEWSKNVAEERDAPWQIMLGCNNSLYCVIINLALWLECMFFKFNYAYHTPYLFAFASNTDIPAGGVANKACLNNILGNKVLKDEILFNKSDQCALGTHSLRKYSSTRARRCGATKDEKDIRGRWKKRITGIR